MRRVARIGHRRHPEPLDQERHTLKAVAAVRIAGMAEEADHRLVELHALRRLRTVRGYRALRPLRGNRAGSVREQQPDECLEYEQTSVSSGVLAE